MGSARASRAVVDALVNHLGAPSRLFQRAVARVAPTARARSDAREARALPIQFAATVFSEMLFCRNNPPKFTEENRAFFFLLRLTWRRPYFEIHNNQSKIMNAYRKILSLTAPALIALAYQGDNMVFLDGHVEWQHWWKWIERSDAAAKRWNYDHQPHEEFWATNRL